MQPPIRGDLMIIDHVIYFLLTGKTMGKNVKKSPWESLTFSFADIFNIPLGFVEGGMMAIKSKVSNELCAKSSINSRANLLLMTG